MTQPLANPILPLDFFPFDLNPGVWETQAWATVAAMLSLGLMLGTAWTWQQKIFQFCCRTILRTVYRIKVVGIENWPDKGGAVVVGNHTTWIDGQLLLVFAPRRTRVIAWSGNFGGIFRKWIAWVSDVILISGGPKSIMRGLKAANQAVRDGEVVGIFPEGGISRTGQIQSFKPGVMRIVRGTGGVVVPVYFDQTWGSLFSYSRGKAIWKWPDAFRRKITITIGKPIPEPDTIYQIRQHLQQTGAESVASRQPPFITPAQKFVRNCKKRKFGFKAADSAGAQVTGGSMLMRTLILRRLLKKHVLDANEKHVGVLIPPSFGGFATNMALALDQRVAVNLNYTVSNSIMNECIRQAGLKHVLTSRKVMEKFDFEFDCKVVYLDDLRKKLTFADKLSGIIGSFVTPGFFLERQLELQNGTQDDVLTIIFTSGSTGVPKGVMLTNQNIATNVMAMDQIVKLSSKDTLLGILPFFHSFGYTVTLWGVAATSIAGAYHFSPLDSMQIGKLCQKHNVTIVLATPTFLRSYLRKCTAEQFHNVDVVVAGAEKLPAELSDAFEKKFGVRPVEGYGATELSPLVSVNVPPSRRGDNYMVDCKEGTVGRPIPGVAARITQVDTGQVLDANQEGTLWIKGPNTMKGYLNMPKKTAEVLQDGWYNTGDVALIDDDGFIKITGRISRFSKIGGEMVPHVIVEDTLSGLLDEDEQDELRFAVTAVPHPKKGEQLVVLHTEIKKDPAEYCKGLTDAGLPNLYIPSTSNFYQVPALPLLGTGKLDLKAMKEMAIDLAS